VWQIDNRTPFGAAQGWVRDRRGAEVWLIVVKATFDILLDGTTRPAAEQPDPLRLAEYHGEPGKSSIRNESDFVLTKTTTDVLVVGHAHAPQGHAVRELEVSLRVGSLVKALRVFGDRRWEGRGPTDPAPFVVMPMVYERAFGGVDRHSPTPEKDWDWRNPVGCGYATSSAHLADQPVPNIEAPDRLIRAWKDRPAPAGFGPIASHWQPRAALAGTYAKDWEQTRQPLLPDDCDDRFFQCAPVDQQTAGFLVGGEVVTLLNLSPLGRLDFALPTMTLGLESRFADGERRAHAVPQLHSVILEPDFPRVSLVWHSALECHAKMHKLDLTRIRWHRPGSDADADESVDNLLDLL
jgi:hypothetical protein